MSESEPQLITMSQLCTALLLSLLISVSCFAESDVDPDALWEMSIEELMNITVNSGTLTGIERMKTPFSMTVISDDEIKNTPAHNLLDLIEVYVPGATYVMHFNGPRIGMRGVLGDQNHSFLLLINGKNINLRTAHGPLFELQNLTLTDIERIEIIRGPGSVTYGAGAVTGIINIISKKENAFSSGSIYSNSNYPYRYGSIYGDYTYRQKDLKIYLNGTYGSSAGLQETKFFYVDRAHGYGYGFMNANWGNRDLGSAAPNALGDYTAQPEVKLNLDLTYKDNIYLWARYSTHDHTKIFQETRTSEGPAHRGLLGKYFIMDIGSRQILSTETEIQADLLFSSKCYRDIHIWQRGTLPLDHIANRSDSYSENILNLHTLFKYSPVNRFKFAVGGEAEYQYYAPEWFEDDSDFLMSMPAPVRFAVLDSSSGFYEYYGSGLTTVIEDRIEAYQFSAFSEISLDLHKYANLIFSGRADKHQFSELALSPRIAVISEIDKANVLKLNWQKSTRLPQFLNLYTEYEVLDQTPKPEVLNGVELAWSSMKGQKCLLNTSAYYNRIEQIAWLNEEGYAGIVGELELIGVELEGHYSGEKLDAGFNYSYIDQLNWDPVRPDEAFLSNIGSDSTDVPLEGSGENRINNLPQNTIKAFCNYKLTSDLSLHVNGRFYWDFGQNDMLDMFKKVHDTYGLPHTREEMNGIYDALKDHGYGEPSFTSNLQLNWKLPTDNLRTYISLYAMNIVQYNHIRYIIQYWESGDQRQYPRQVGFIKEPISVGLKFKITF